MVLPKAHWQQAKAALRQQVKAEYKENHRPAGEPLIYCHLSNYFWVANAPNNVMVQAEDAIANFKPPAEMTTIRFFKNSGKTYLDVAAYPTDEYENESLLKRCIRQSASP